jgi:hypothetical protein
MTTEFAKPDFERVVGVSREFVRATKKRLLGTRQITPARAEGLSARHLRTRRASRPWVRSKTHEVARTTLVAHAAPHAMFVEEVCIDGFKSYARRTVVPSFDPLFNAITGLNGSGKSNILDAICFVLGITNLSQVRCGRTDPWPWHRLVSRQVPLFAKRPAKSDPNPKKTHPQVRAASLQELVYKQGQAGVTKASVSIVFNNSDRTRSPVGYGTCVFPKS